MTPGASKENARTLGALLGVAEDRAVQLLGQRILVTAASGEAARIFAAEVVRLLGRTFTQVDNAAQPGASYATEVVIGYVARRAHASIPVVYIALKEDEVIIGAASTEEAPQEPCHALILLIGACYAVAAATRAAIPSLVVPPQVPVVISKTTLLGSDAQVLRERIQLGEVHLAGAGAIGNAYLWALQTLDVEGTIHVCDVDSVSEGNLNRCLFFEPEHLGLNKAVVLSEQAQKGLPGVLLLPYPHRVEAFPSDPTGRTFKRLVVGVDSRRARRALQLEFPKEVYDASTTGIDEVILHFNSIPLTAACLSCIYHQEQDELARERHIAEMLGVDVADVRTNWVTPQAADRILARYPDLEQARLVGEAYDSLFKALCGQGLLRSPEGRQVLAPFAFVSALAGALLALEVARRVYRGRPVGPFNYWRVSPWAPPSARLQRFVARRDGCEFCGTKVYRLGSGIWS